VVTGTGEGEQSSRHSWCILAEFCKYARKALPVPVPLYQAKAEFFRTLGHPARIRVLELLAEGDRPVRDLLSAIDVEAPNLSHQLAVLRLAGLVSQRREGGQVIYSLALPAVRDLLANARAILQTKTADQGGLVDDITPAARG
jgi:DNA-binding transcriptional ArsR family regulator